MRRTLSFGIRIGLVALCVCALLGAGNNVRAGDLEDGMTAYTRKDYATALRLFRPLAEQGNANAQFGLGELYGLGQGVALNYQEAARWYQAAADQGLAIAQETLGIMYAKGNGVLQDYRTAAKWYRLAAVQGRHLQGSTEAQNHLGVLYWKGLGVPQSYKIAHMWFNLSALNYNVGASENREMVEKTMSSEEINKAQKMAELCLASHYKDCAE